MNKVLPGSFNRIIAMTEQLQAAQIREAEAIRTYTHIDTKRGQHLGFYTTVLAMAGAIYCANINAWVSGLFLGVPVMAVARSLIESAKKEKPSDMVRAAAQSAANPSGPKTSPPAGGIP